MKSFLIKQPVRFLGKTDCHPSKGFINWWEDMGRFKSKTAKRMRLNRELLNELNYEQ